MLHGRRLRNGSGRVRPWRLAFVLLAILAGGAIGVRAQDVTRRVLILYPDSYVNRSGLIAGDASGDTRTSRRMGSFSTSRSSRTMHTGS